MKFYKNVSYKFNNLNKYGIIILSKFNPWIVIQSSTDADTSPGPSRTTTVNNILLSQRSWFPSNWPGRTHNQSSTLQHRYRRQYRGHQRWNPKTCSSGGRAHSGSPTTKGCSRGQIANSVANPSIWSRISIP